MVRRLPPLNLGTISLTQRIILKAAPPPDSAQRRVQRHCRGYSGFAGQSVSRCAPQGRRRGFRRAETPYMPQVGALAGIAAGCAFRRLSRSSVSGIANQNTASPTPATAARNRNAALYPASTTMTPAKVVLRAAPMLSAVVIAPWLTLNLPVPRV